MKTKILMFGLVLTLMTIGCSKDKDADSTRVNFTAEEAGINTKIDFLNDDINKISEEQLNVSDGISGKIATPTAFFLPACATVTRVPAIGTLPNVGSTVVKTIDFGTTGCPMPNGNILRGKIILSFLYEPTATTHVINCTFDNFYHNLRKIEGTKTFTRTLTAQTAASPSHPIWVMNMNLVITLPDGKVLNRVGTRTSEIIAGYSTPLDWTDNEYSVTGNWTTTFPNSTLLTSTITSPLIVKFACVPTNSAISQGIISFVRNSNTATLDYGNGSCDNQAIFTINGISYPITLGN
jgi:hypothetical protein